MGGFITLHPKKGVNPRMSCCISCNADLGEIILLGNKEYKGVCRNCNALVYGVTAGKCPKCQSKAGYDNVELIGDCERIPTGLCDNCTKEYEKYDKIVADGGVYWRCSDCKQGGVIKNTEFTKAVRSRMGIPAPKPCGVEFTQKDCPLCNNNKH